MTYDQNAQGWTAAQTLSDVRRKASLPATSTDFSDVVLLREISDVLWSFAGWAYSQGGEGRLLSTLERPISAAYTSAYRAGTEIPLPALAVADTIDNVTWLNSTGDAQRRLSRLEVAQESDLDTPGSAGDPQGYALMDGRIRLYPQPSTGGTIRFTYQRRHPELVVDGTANGVMPVLSLSALPGSTTQTILGVAISPGYAVGDEIDILSSNYPYRYAAVSVTIAGYFTPPTVLTLNLPFAYLANQPSTSTAQLRTVRAGVSPYIHFPLELRAAVTEKVTANVLRIFGDLQGSQAAEIAAKEELSRVMQMLSPRAKRDKPKAVNPYSHLRAGATRFRRW